MEQTQEQFKTELARRSESSDWNCAIAGCVLKSVRRRTQIRGAACVLVLTGVFSTGVFSAGGIEPAMDTVAEFFVPDALNPMRSIREPFIANEMDMLLQVALRE